MIDLTMPMVAEYFEDVGDGHWRCKQTQMIIHGVILDFYKQMNGLTLFGLPFTMEVYPFFDTYTPPDIAAVQKFERAILAHDPRKLLNPPPSSGSVYLMPLNASVKRELRFNKYYSRYEGITSSFHHIAVVNAIPFLQLGVYISTGDVERDAEADLVPRENEQFDPDWWEARIDKTENIFYFDAIKDWERS